MKRAFAFSSSFDRDLAKTRSAILYVGDQNALTIASARQKAGHRNTIGLIKSTPQNTDFSALFGISVVVVVADYLDDFSPRDVVIELLKSGCTSIAVLDQFGVALDDDGNALVVTE